MQTDKMNDLWTSRSGMPALLGSVSRLPNKERMAHNHYVPESKPNKFRKGCRELKTCETNSYELSAQKEWRSSIRVYTIEDSGLFTTQNPQMTVRRSRAQGIFKRQTSIDLSFNPRSSQRGSIQDIGVDRNRKGRNNINAKIVRPNPMFIVRQVLPLKTRKHFHNQKRNMRDNGQEFLKSFAWGNKTKSTTSTTNSYAKIHSRKFQ